MATFTLVARNGGFQEAHVAMTVTLPAGLVPVTATLPSDMTYDPAGRTLTWEAPTCCGRGNGRTAASRRRLLPASLQAAWQPSGVPCFLADRGLDARTAPTLPRP